ncbi:extracellular solute-binding protein [Streptomyces sp. NPDC051940]|uniref:sugar ABC transporter substrate-binding protein n=1 Tax=Streptomyces sp. NPDC051940 TaxID=3155675 RepID=UPI0034329AC8
MKKRTTLTALAGCLALLTAAGCSDGFDDDSGPAQDKGGKQTLTVLIATSGDAETAAVKAATAAYEKKSGNTVRVETAKDMNQQLGQAFAGGKPPDVFYVNSDQFANYASGGSLFPYTDAIDDVDDFSETLRRSFTYDGKLVCVPKDMSSLALAVNTDLWQAAGLTDADFPKTWDQLHSVARTLTKGGVTGLVTTNEYQRLGAFMKEAGGWITDPDQTKMTADTAQNAEGLGFVKKMLADGSMKYMTDVDAGWGGEALGKGKAAMTIEGSWLAGAMKNDFPDVKYKVVDMPEGPGGKGTLAFTNCWGVAQDSSHRDAAVELVKHLTEPAQQLAMGNGFGAIPARLSAAQDYLAQHPEQAPWGAAGDWVQGPVTVKGIDKVLGQFNTDLQKLKTADPAKILGDLQRNGQSVVESGQ